jgi:hypothetical protein
MKEASRDLWDKVATLDEGHGIPVWAHTQAEIQQLIQTLTRIKDQMIIEGVAILPDCPEE